MRPLVVNPLNLRGKGRSQQKRKKAAHEASKAQQRERRAQKKSRQTDVKKKYFSWVIQSSSFRRAAVL